jgi:hypothetical protein
LGWFVAPGICPNPSRPVLLVRMAVWASATVTCGFDPATTLAS